MIKLELDSYIPVKEYTQELSDEPHIYYDMVRLERLLKSLSAKIRSRDTQMVSFIYNYLGFRPDSLDRSIVERLFEKAYVEPKFYINKEGNFTNTKDKKLQMLESGVLEDFNMLSLNRSSASTEHSKIVKVIQRSYCRKKVEGNNGTLVEIPFEVIPSRNRRFNTQEENVIGMHKIITPSMESKKGYLLIQGDFPQIDGRGALNIYFSSKFTRELMNTIDDAYLVFKEMGRWFSYLEALDFLDKALKSETPIDTIKQENIISKFQSEIIPFSDKNHRNLFKVIALRTVYNSSSSPLLSEDREIRKLSVSLNAMPLYAAMRHYSLYLKNVGYPVIVKSMFGYERQILETKEFTFLAQVFNAPIQATSSEVVMHLIMTAINHFRELGFGKDEIRIYLNRHDEPIFEVEEEFFKEHYDYFNDISWVSVPGWRPFKIDWMVSHKYGVSLSEYTSLVNTQVECPDNHIDKKVAFFPLKMPRLMAFMKRELIDDRIILLLSEFVGDFPDDNFRFGKFKDQRDIVFDAKISKLNGIIPNDKYILSVISTMLQNLETSDIPLLIFIPGFPVLTHLDMSGHDVWVTGEPNDLGVINNSIMASVVNNLDPELLDEGLLYWFKHSERLNGRIKQR